MKPVVVSLLKRNALVILVFVLLLTGLRVVLRGYTPPWLTIPIAFFCGLLWANALLLKRGRPVLTVLLSLLLFPILGFPALIGSILLGRSVVEWEYKVEGFQMVDGCNGAEANRAYFEVHTLEERLAELTNAPSTDNNLIVQLQKVYATAQEKRRVLSDDCARRYHCDTHPWKTNWATIDQALAASERVHQ